MNNKAGLLFRHPLILCGTPYAPISSRSPRVASQVCIHSPPRAPGLSDPDTYHQKFSTHGEIAFITICLSNGILLKVSLFGSVGYE